MRDKVRKLEETTVRMPTTQTRTHGIQVGCWTWGALAWLLSVSCAYSKDSQKDCDKNTGPDASAVSPADSAADLAIAVAPLADAAVADGAPDVPTMADGAVAESALDSAPDVATHADVAAGAGIDASEGGGPDLGPAAQPCRPRQILASGYEVRQSTQISDAGIISEFQSPPACTIDNTGAVVLTFVPPVCHKQQSWWVGCVFQGHQDMQGFEAGQDGILAVKICVENLPRVAVNLRYGPHGYLSKFMELLSGNRDQPATICQTLYLGSDDSCYSSDQCGPICPSSAKAVDAGAIGVSVDSGATIDGGDATPEATCSDFASSELVLMTEWCQEEGASQTAQATVRLESVVKYPASCQCQSDSDCAAPNVCRSDGWPDSAQCWNDPKGCPAICATGIPGGS